MARTLTAANSVLTLAIARLYDSPQQIQGYAADNVTNTETVAPAETVDGVDGVLSAGWIYVSVTQNFSLQGDSMSVDIIERWYQTQQQLREILYATGSLIVPSLNKKYTMTRGVLMAFNPTPSVGKIIQPRPFSIKWGTVTSAPYGA